MKKLGKELEKLIKKAPNKQYNVVIVFNPNTIDKITCEKLDILMANIASAKLFGDEIIKLNNNSAIISIELDNEKRIQL